MYWLICIIINGINSMAVTCFLQCTRNLCDGPMCMYLSLYSSIPGYASHVRDCVGTHHTVSLKSATAQEGGSRLQVLSRYPQSITNFTSKAREGKGSKETRILKRHSFESRSRNRSRPPEYKLSSEFDPFSGRIYPQASGGTPSSSTAPSFKRLSPSKPLKDFKPLRNLHGHRKLD